MTDETMRKVIKNLWIQVSKLRNPWFAAMASNLDGYREKWDLWNTHHVELMRAMFDVVFGKAPPTEHLVMSALALIDGGIEP